MPDEIKSQENSKTKAKNENDDGHKIVIALLFLLVSFGCIFCSSQGALWFISDDRVEASILSGRMADYGTGLGVEVAPLDSALAAEAFQDRILLQQTVTTLGIGDAVVMLIPTALPSPTSVFVAQLPTMTPTTAPPPPPATPNPTLGPATATPLPTVELPPTVLPTLTPVPPSPTNIIPTPTETLPPTIVPTNTPIVPTSTSVSPTATNTPVPPAISFGATNFNVNESAGTVTVSVILSAASANTVTVNYTTSNGSAIAPGDYTATGSTLTFSPGVILRTFTIPIINDSVIELSETFMVTLSNPVNATLNTPNPATVTIIDNDVPNVQFSNATYSVSENQGTALITVTLSAPSPATVTVDYATSDGTAIAGSDYTAVADTLTFPPFQTSMNFTVPITDDVLANEFTETISITLSNPTNAVIVAPNPATLEIVDDDLLEVEFSSFDYTVVEDAVTATITVTLNAVSAVPVTVTYTTSDGSAVANSDYVSTSGTLLFDPGDTLRTFTVTIINNAGAEAPETLSLDLSNPVNATLGATRPATLTIIDDGDIGGCTAFMPPTVELGPPDCRWTALDGATVVVALPVSIIADGDPDYDLVYYEREAPVSTGYVAMDRVSVWVGTSATGPWVEVFNWGDGLPNPNTNIAGLGPAAEDNDYQFPLTMPPLYRPSAGAIASGFAIDIDAVAPPGTYTHVQLVGAGTAEVDSIDVIP